MSNQEKTIVNFEFAEEYNKLSLPDDVVILHEDFKLEVLNETLKPVRKRHKGTMLTLDINSFLEYVKTRITQAGAELAHTFIDAGSPKSYLEATTVLNFGDYSSPGHADDLAKVELHKDPLFTEFLDNLTQKLTATTFAETLENFLGLNIVKAYNNDDTEIVLAKAISGIRNAKIERNVSSSLNTNGLNYEASDNEKIEIQAQAETLPNYFIITTPLYLGLPNTQIKFYVDTKYVEKEGAGTKVLYSCRPVGLLGQYLKAAEDFKALISQDLEQVTIGVYSKKN